MALKPQNNKINKTMIAPKCTCGDNLYYCTAGSSNCKNGITDSLILPATNDEGQGEYNELWTEVIHKIEDDNTNVSLYCDTVSWLQQHFNITRKVNP